MTVRGPKLQDLVNSTLATCADLVGATLGPGGMSVIIERQEPGLPPVVTKDGVTVFKSLGFSDPTQQVIMEAGREASLRTASEAGDGTTTATILQAELTKSLTKVTRANPHMSAQLIVRELNRIFKNVLEPELQKSALPANMGKYRSRLFNVARISANGDAPLANAVMDCFDLVGDEGNVTITEATGLPEYVVEKIDGYPIMMGYEESCGPFFQEFINDRATQQTSLKKPLWILYHGSLTDYNEIFTIAQVVASEASAGKCQPNIVVAATGFSEAFVAQCAAAFRMEGAVRVFPLLAPRTIQQTAQLDFLEDLAALTTAKVFNPLTAPLDSWEVLSDFGNGPGPEKFEAGRYRSTVIGFADELAVVDRADAIDKQLAGQSLSERDAQLLRERKAKLTSGIARLIVRGPSNGEVKERRDRAEDAVCAVRAAIKHGALPGGGLTWVNLAMLAATEGVKTESNVARTVLLDVVAPSLEAPLTRLFANAGYSEPETAKIIEKMGTEQTRLDLTTQEWLPAGDESLLDAYSAVREALANAISVAGSLGTCGGTVVFGRDLELERREAVEAADYMRAVTSNEANQRG